MIKPNTFYKFKAEFAKELNIPTNQIDRRQKELLQWLTNFFDFEFYEGKPKRIFIKTILGDYQPLPRKLPDQSALTQEKKERYKNYVIASLGTDYKPNSQAFIAREGIAAFGNKLYHHKNYKAVAERYVREPMKKYGESDNKKIWVWFSTYEPLDKETLSDWRSILAEEKISEKEAACAFYRQEQGEDISKEKNYFKKAQERFIDRYQDFAVLVSSWRLKQLTTEEK